MTALGPLMIAAGLATVLTACAQAPATPTNAGMPGPAASAAAPAERFADMDAHMQAMRAMHEKMAAARTPEERSALMAEHGQLMQQGMALMGGMGPGGMHGMGMGGMMGPGHMRGMVGGSGTQSGPPGPADPAARQQMMEKRMEMMQSMMQMMMDRMPPPGR